MAMLYVLTWLAHGAMRNGTGMLADEDDTGDGIDTPLDDSWLYLYTDDGSGAPSADYVADNDDGDDLPDGYNGYASRIVYTATYTGTHFAKMTPYSDGYAGAFDFIFDTTCLISQENCEEDGGTFGVCSTAPGLENRLKCTEAADGYSLDADGTVMISRQILCDRYHAGGKDFDRADDSRFCTALVSERQPLLLARSLLHASRPVAFPSYQFGSSSTRRVHAQFTSHADESTRNCKRCDVTVVDNVVTAKSWSGCD